MYNDLLIFQTQPRKKHTPRCGIENATPKTWHMMLNARLLRAFLVGPLACFLEGVLGCDLIRGDY